MLVFFFFSSRRRHTRCYRDWSSDVCSSDLGLGVALSGRPFENPGGIRLDEGTFTGYSADPGVPPPVYRLYDQVRSWGVGVSLAGVAGTIAALRQRPAPGFARHADLAFGYSEKSVELAPEAPALDGRGTARD